MRTFSHNRLVNDPMRCFASGVIFTVVVVAKVVVLIGLITLAAQAYEGPDIVVTGENISTRAPFIAVTNHVEKGMVHFRVAVSPHAFESDREFVGWLSIREEAADTPRDEQHPIAFAAIKSADVAVGIPAQGKKGGSLVAFEFRVAKKFLESSDFTLWETVPANAGMTANKFRLALASFLPSQAINQASNTPALRCRLLAPPKPTSGTLRLELVLTNENSKPVKVCTACLPGHTPIKVLADGTQDIQVILGPDRSEGDMQTAKGVAQSIVTLQPGSTVKIPFNLFPDPHTTMRVTAHYVVPKHSDRIDGAEYELLDMWRGKITAEPIVIHVNE